VSALAIKANGVYLDATFGRGGHSQEILKSLGTDGTLLVLDKDPEAIAVAEQLQQQDARVLVEKAPFADIDQLVSKHFGVSDERTSGAGKLDGILFDLGVSSPQLDDPQRGFSFMQDGRLDMRMNPDQGISAAQWIAEAKEAEIADVLYEFGEERHSRRMARAIVAERKESPITSTGRLAEIVKAANPSWERDKHPATRAFQGIRIFINQELHELDQALVKALELLTIGGRLVVISFHSLEDRMVKKFISVQTKGDSFPRHLPVPQSQLNPRLKSIGKAVKADSNEVRDNPRARSAIMRTAEKIA